MSNFVIALQITAIGMGLVFAAIILIWWMMALLTKFTEEKEPSGPTGSDSSKEYEEKAQAAAIGVAIAMAEHKLSQTHPLLTPPTAIVSAWQLGMRTRQLSEKGTPLVRNPRKIGK